MPPAPFSCPTLAQGAPSGGAPVLVEELASTMPSARKLRTRKKTTQAIRLGDEPHGHRSQSKIMALFDIISVELAQVVPISASVVTAILTPEEGLQSALQ